MKKIVVLDGACARQNDLNYDFLREYGDVVLYEKTSKDLVLARLKDAEIVITNKVNIDKNIIDSCPSIKFITVLATGYNIIDCEYAKSKGIIVCNVPSYSTDSVAQHTFALLLEICSHTGEHAKSVADGKWCSASDFCYCLTPIVELKNKTFGIIGYGNIGKAVQKIAEAFGMKVLINNRTPFAGSVTLEDIYKNSDIVSLHCPLTKNNIEMINEDTLKMFKSDAILINTSRGGLINEKALSEALNSGRLSGFGGDVLSTEPALKDNPLLRAKNAIITPHIAWASREARQRLLNITKANIDGFLNGCIINRVN